VAVSGVTYDKTFFASRSEKVRRSADVIVPHVLNLIRPSSVIDVGCGTGTWLATFARHGIDDYLGVDGDWVPRGLLEIPAGRFVPAHLDAEFRLDRTFDLALSLEVAEHLPESAAARFVDTLVRLAPSVLFSAAVPHQGGRNHLNEQWQGYWAALFRGHDYEPVDVVRPHVWADERLPFWYVQNTLLYARPEVIAAAPALSAARKPTAASMLSLAHPRMVARIAANPDAHLRRATARELSLRELADAFPRVLARSIRFRVGRLARRR
jgi:SAM-dependent methyltransferase